MRKDQKGSSHLAIIGTVVLIGTIGFAAWNVLQNNKNPYTIQKTLDSAIDDKKPELTEVVDTTQVPELKEYSNPSIGLAFMYPSDWELQESIQDLPDLGMEGSVSVVSPAGLNLHINPNHGGKGGGCIYDPTDTPHNTLNCSTFEILHKEKVADYEDIEDVYLYRFKTTRPRSEDGTVPKSVYSVYLSSSEELSSTNEPVLISDYEDRGNTYDKDSKPSNLATFVTGADLSSADFFMTADEQKAEDVLRSVRRL